MSSLVEKLRELCRQWGGDLVEITEAQYEALVREGTDEFQPAPFTDKNLGVDYINKIVYYANKPWYSILHEMGHVFASREEPNRATNEYDFFGWELAVVKLIGANVDEWVRGNCDYVVTGDVDLGSLSLDGVAKILEEIEGLARDRGLTVDGRPVAIR